MRRRRLKEPHGTGVRRTEASISAARSSASSAGVDRDPFKTRRPAPHRFVPCARRSSVGCSLDGVPDIAFPWDRAGIWQAP
jgi:hypothetical protein